MPTVDIISPGGAFTPAAVGDTQELTTTWTVLAGSPTTLTCNGASPFVSGDTGKSFVLHGAGTQGQGDPTYLTGTLTYVSSNQVTLSTPATVFLNAATEYFAWGTDDAPAWRAFNTWAQSQGSAITLTMGSGSKTFLLATNDSSGLRANSLTYNVPQTVHILGNGHASTKIIGSPTVGIVVGALNTIKSGDGNYGGSSIWTARLNSVAAGATSLTCKTIADASLFANNTYAYLSGIDMQGSGSPPNQFYFEYVFITNVNTSTGVITLSTPTVNAYLDSWPVFNAGTPGAQPDRGGPATLYVLDQAWNITFTYEGLSFNNLKTQTYMSAYSANFVDITVIDGYGLTPSINYLASFTNCDISSYQMEYDKGVWQTTFDNTKTSQLFFQSSDYKVIIQNGCNITGGLNGTPRFLEIHDSTVTNISIGTPGFGRTESVISTNTTYTGTGGFSGSQSDSTNIQSDYSISGGVITIPRSTLTYGCRWMIPNQICYFTGSAKWTLFKVLAVTADATNVYVTTDWPYGGFPTWATTIQTISSFYMNFDTNTVATDPTILNFVTSTTAGYFRPSTYTAASFNGSNLGIDATGFTATFPQATGKLVSYTINVTTPYTGTNSSLFWHAFAEFDNSTVIKADLSTGTYGPHIDLRTAGTRVITPTGATLLGADSALAVPSNPTWITQAPGNGGTSGGLCANHNIQAEYNGNPSVGPVLNIILITDQGTGSAPITSQGGIFAIQNQSNMVIRGRTR